MHRKSRNLLIASSVAMAMAGFGGNAAGDTMSQDVIDARHETQIWTTYALSPYLRANDLKVSVKNGTATLTGKVEEDVSKDLAKQIALGVDGVKNVENQIVVEPGFVAPKRSGNSYADTIDDASLAAAVRSKLAWSQYEGAATTKVNAKAGRVTLSGTADSTAAKDLAASLAMNTRGVVSVDNNLMVDGTKATYASKDAPAAKHGNDITDSWITTKVKSTYAYSSNVDGSDIGVVTKDGVVTLTGEVDSGAERALAIELAKNIRGVKSVGSSALTLPRS
jgi:osmotically-inducible protein OsmY